MLYTTKILINLIYRIVYYSIFMWIKSILIEGLSFPVSIISKS